MYGREKILTWAEGKALLGAKGFRTAVRRGELVRGYPGVYAPPRYLWRWEMELAAVVKWAGQDALASHVAAAHLHELDLLRRCDFSVTVPLDRNPRLPQVLGREPVRVYRCEEIPKAQRTTVRDLPCTSLAWTCLDLASIFPPMPLAVAFESAWRQRPQLFLGWVERLLEQHWRGRKFGALEQVLADCHRRSKPMRSALEVQLWYLLLDLVAPIGRATPGHWVKDAHGSMEIDFAYLPEKVAIEAKGFGVHGGRKAAEKDADRESRLLAMGWRVLTATQAMVDEPAELSERILKTVLLARAA